MLSALRTVLAPSRRLLCRRTLSAAASKPSQQHQDDQEHDEDDEDLEDDEDEEEDLEDAEHEAEQLEEEDDDEDLEDDGVVVIKVKGKPVKLQNFSIPEDEIVEKHVRSGGPGGQKVNKTSSCVFLKHIPSGITVKCQSQRSLRHNQKAAYKLLYEKVAERIYNIPTKSKLKVIKKAKNKDRRKSRRNKAVREEVQAFMSNPDFPGANLLMLYLHLDSIVPKAAAKQDDLLLWKGRRR